MLNLLEALDERIEIVDSVTSWEEAVRIGGQMLEKDQVIESSYAEKMLSVSKELGPYVVIAPGIAIPHARPEDGAKRFGLSLLVIRNGVNFGSHNDPVFLVLCFATPNKEAHLEFLKQLGEILQNSERIAGEMVRLKDADEVCGYLESLLRRRDQVSSNG